MGRRKDIGISGEKGTGMDDKMDCTIDNIMNRSEDMGELMFQPDDDMIVCRCEEVTKGEIRQAVHDGMRTLNEIKRYLRAGMGLCQGQTCTKLVQAIVAREIGIKAVKLDLGTARGPVRPTQMGVYAKEIIEEEQYEA